MPHNNYENFDNLCEEALIADLLPLLHYSLYLFPDPLLSRRSAIRGGQKDFTEEGIDEFRDQLGLE